MCNAALGAYGGRTPQSQPRRPYASTPGYDTTDGISAMSVQSNSEGSKFEEVFAAFVNDLRQAKTLSEANIAAGIAWNDLRGVTE
jgi:hypothetical protein